MARSKLLSQEEIDALLKSGLDQQERTKQEHKRTIRIYDFRHPDRVSRDQIRALKNINDRFVRAFATYLSNILRTIVDIRISTIDQVTYSEFLMSLEDPTCLYTVILKALKGKGIFQMDMGLFFMILDRLLGGPGTFVEKQRVMTVIEQQIMEKTIKKALEFLNEAMSHVQPLDPVLESFETNPQFVRIASPSETVIVFVFDVTIMERTHSFNICIPFFSFENTIHKVTAQTYMEMREEKHTHEDTEIIRSHLNDVKVPVVIKLGGTVITIEDFLKLQLGDILITDRKVDEPLEGLIKGLLKIRGIPGIIGRNKALQVVETLKPPEFISKSSGGKR